MREKGESYSRYSVSEERSTRGVAFDRVGMPIGIALTTAVCILRALSY